jgi:hypothetical protein
MNTLPGPNLTDLETIHSLAWRVTATPSVAFGRARSTAVWRREDTVHPPCRRWEGHGLRRGTPRMA